MKFSELNYKGVKWDVNTKDFTYLKCSELELNKKIDVYGFFITPDSGYGRGAVAIADTYLINLPQRYVETIETILSNKDMIKAIKDGHVSIMIDSFISSKYKHTGYDVTFIDDREE